MKKCKANYIKILTAMRDNCYDMAKIWEEDRETEKAKAERQEGQAYQVAIWLLSDYNNSFAGYGKIYFPEEFEEE